jgi:hypothetical protein
MEDAEIAHFKSALGQVVLQHGDSVLLSTRRPVDLQLAASQWAAYLEDIHELDFNKQSKQREEKGGGWSSLQGKGNFLIPVQVCQPCNPKTLKP